MLRRRNSGAVVGDGEESVDQRSTELVSAAAETNPTFLLSLNPSHSSEQLSPILSPDAAVSPSASTTIASILLPDSSTNSSTNSAAASALPSPSYLDRLVTTDPLLAPAANDDSTTSSPADLYSSSKPPSYPASAYDYFSSPTFPVSSLVSQLFRLSFPNILSCLISSSIQLTSTLFLGHVSTTALSSAVVGNMICNLTGASLGLGFTTCLDALCSQAYGGRRYMLCGLHAQKGLAMMTIACVPVALIWMQTERIALLMGLEAETASMAQLWSNYLIFSIYPFFMGEVMKRWLTAQRVLWPVVAASIATIVWNIAGNSFCIYKLKMGFEGPAIVMALSHWVMLAVLVSCIVGRQKWGKRQLKQREEQAAEERRRTEEVADALDSEMQAEVEQSPVGALTERVPQWAAVLRKTNQYTKLTQDSTSATPATSSPFSSTPVTTSTTAAPSTATTTATTVHTSDDTEFHDCWPPLSYAIFTNWGEHMRLGLPGAFSMFLEWGSYEVSAAFAGILGGTQLAVHGVFMSSVSLWYTVPLGLSTATAAMIGNQLGGGEAKNAALTAQISMLCCLLWGLLNGILFTSFLRPHWISLFSDDLAVQQLATSSMAVLLFYGLFDSSKCVLMSILRGCGRPVVTVYGNVLSCWFVQFPLAYLMLVRWQYGLVALWASMTAAWATATLVYGLVMARTDWEDECRKALLRNETSEDDTTGSAKLNPSSAQGETQVAEAVVEQGRGEKEVGVWEHKQHAAIASDDELSSLETLTDESDYDEQEDLSPPASVARVTMVSAWR